MNSNIEISESFLVVEIQMHIALKVILFYIIGEWS